MIMKRRSFMAWLLSGFGLAATKADDRDQVVDTTSFVSGGRQESKSGFTARVAVEADNIKIKCGSLEITSSTGAGKDTAVFIDGRPAAAKSIVLKCDVRGVWSVSM
jgi:lipopolysaccharide export system protein LptA